MLGSKFDEIDCMIFVELQVDGCMINVELVKRVGILVLFCLCCVCIFEEQGYICGYYVDVDLWEFGFEVQVFVMVGLVKQVEFDLLVFEKLCYIWLLVWECYMFNGEVDFLLKCVVFDLCIFQNFLIESLIVVLNVVSVKISLVICCDKDELGVLFDVLEECLCCDVQVVFI